MDNKQITQQEWDNIVEQLKGRDEALRKQGENISFLQDKLSSVEIHVEALTYLIKAYRNHDNKESHWQEILDCIHRE